MQQDKRQFSVKLPAALARRLVDFKQRTGVVYQRIFETAIAEFLASREGRLADAGVHIAPAPALASSQTENPAPPVADKEPNINI